MAFLALTRRAFRDLEEIEAYSRARWGERIASEYIDGFEQAFQRLKDNPDLLETKSAVSGYFKFYR